MITSGLTDEGVRVSSSGESGDEFRFTRKAGIPFPMMGLIIPGSKTSRVRGARTAAALGSTRLGSSH